jgi:hypothetical protein
VLQQRKLAGEYGLEELSITKMVIHIISEEKTFKLCQDRRMRNFMLEREGLGFGNHPRKERPRGEDHQEDCDDMGIEGEWEEVLINS